MRRRVVVTDVLPAGVALVSATWPSGTCTDTAGTLSCDLGALADGASVVVTVVVTVSPSFVVPGDLSNTATVASATTDPVPGDNSATATVAVGSSADVGTHQDRFAQPGRWRGTR